MNLPDTPVTTLITVASAGVLGVTAYFVKKSSDDRKHLVNSHLRMKEIDAEVQANVLNQIKEITTNKI